MCRPRRACRENPAACEGTWSLRFYRAWAGKCKERRGCPTVLLLRRVVDHYTSGAVRLDRPGIAGNDRVADQSAGTEHGKSERLVQKHRISRSGAECNGNPIAAVGDRGVPGCHPAGFGQNDAVAEILEGAAVPD